MDSHSLDILEFPLLLDKVAGFTTWPPGREEVLALSPLEDMEAIRLVQNRVRDVMGLKARGVSLGLAGVKDVRPLLQGIIRGAVPEPADFWTLRCFLEASASIGVTLRSNSDICPELRLWGNKLRGAPDLQDEIEKVVSNTGAVNDEASDALKRIRRDLSKAREKVSRIMRTLLASPELGRLLQERLMTQRSGRMVFPVKSEYGGRFPGLVIERSSSGATLFMEPWEVVEPYNQVKALESKERNEVEKILRQLSALVRLRAEELLREVDILAKLDCLGAIASWADKVGAVLPDLVSSGGILLQQARHPLLTGEVVPVSLELGGRFNTLVITGPNTGGKTVCLKTLGLLTVAALSGLPIPAAEGSRVQVVEQVWADIGDEQSIAQNLSTFSGHLRQIRPILEQADSNSLVLLDELGAGTDPAEGGALGIAILEHLTRRGVLTAVTTHLSQLKVYASQTEGFENAAVEFDTVSLRPTFRLLMGIPGKSNALRIAACLGVPQEVITRAQYFLGQGYTGVEEILDDLREERDALRGLEEKLSRESRSAQELRIRYESDLERLKEEKDKILAEAAKQAEQMLGEARNRIRAMLRDLRGRLAALRRQKELEADDVDDGLGGDRFEDWEARDAELGLRGDEWPDYMLICQTSGTSSGEREQLDNDYDLATVSCEIEAELREIQDKWSTFLGTSTKSGANKKNRKQQDRKFVPGDRVYCHSFGQVGTVEKHKEDKVELRIGVIRVTVKQDDLELVREEPSQKVEVVLPSSGRETFVPELDLRGLTVDEAIYELERKLDMAVRAGADKLEVIHGKGTGALRAGIHRWLRGCDRIVSYRLGEVYEGGSGVTIVRLKGAG